MEHFRNNMKHFFIVANEEKDLHLHMTLQMQKYIMEKGGTCQYGLNRRMSPNGYRNLKAKEVPADTECVLCVGGDGTLIRVAGNLVEKGLPIIGVNLGHVGYLCELDANTVFGAIDQLMQEHYMIEERMMLSGYCIKNETECRPRPALNDIVIHRTGGMQVVNLMISVNGEYLNTYRADGIIVATPTGSTAYSMSAGGPIVDPKAKLIVITPISPHGLNSKSIVLDAEDEITVEIGSRRMEKDEETKVSFDGDESLTLAVGDKIVINRAKTHVKILKLNKRSFLEILRKKMQEYT